ncbi:MAG: hypothetical protein ABIP51_04810 [Bacteroidia bacterium]
MSNTNENKQENKQKVSEILEEKKDWMDHLNDFIKNPITTGITGLAAGYLLATYKANKDIEAINAQHKKEISERDEILKLAIKQIQTTNKLIARQFKALPSSEDESEENNEDENTVDMEQDKKTKVYNPKKKKKHFELK